MVTIRPVRPDEVEHCVALGVAAFEAIPASDLARERLLGGLAPNGRDWRYRRGQSFLAEFARGARLSGLRYSIVPVPRRAAVRVPF